MSNRYSSLETPNDNKNYINEAGQVEWGKMPLNAALDKLKSSREGLTTAEAEARFAKYGPNKLPEEKVSKIMVFLSFMWNPLSWAMEVAAIIAIILLDFVDFALVIALLLLNAGIGYFEEMQAGDAVAALMDQLAPESKVFRDGQIQNMGADKLVPGDVIRIRLGDVVPADLKLLEGDDMKIDQSSLTGESLPVTKSTGDEAYSGSVVKQGEIEAVVVETGANTFLGRAADQINNAESHGRLQEVLTTVGNFCLVSIVIMVIIELAVQMGGRKNENPCKLATEACTGVQNILVLIVGGIPVAMPTVLSVTLAIGSSSLAKQSAIVTRLTSIEEMASMEILCSDKTGTLTLNQLSVDFSNLIPYNGFSTDQILRDGALAARTENNEPIDIVCFESYPGKDTLWDEYTLLHYTPFDPVSKRTIAKIKHNATGKIFRTSKGAPQIILDMDVNADSLRQEVEERIDEYASRGYRALGVGIDESGDVPVEECKWKMVGLLPLFDPPRHDTADTVKRAIELGVAVKMVTGDQRAIAIETSRQLGMPTNILDTSIFNEAPPPGVDMAQLVYETDGFAQVFPEHKFEIVRQLQSLDKVVGMTGDGVNDAPALAQAQIGIAVDDATDAARAAADIVLVSPGLSVIITAIQHSREIFLRMKNYAMYSIAMTVRIVLTFGILTVAWRWYFPTLLIVILAILNDGTILTISKDNVKASPTPDSWKLKEVFINSIMFGVWLTISTVVLFAIVYESTAFSGFIDSENLCVRCQHNDCDDQMRTHWNNNRGKCGDMNGDIAADATLADIGDCRKQFVDEYIKFYDSKDHQKFSDFFKGVMNDNPNTMIGKVSIKDTYEQYVYQYTAGQSGSTTEAYNLTEAVLSSDGVTSSSSNLAMTNGWGYCDFLWSYTNFNSTMTNDKNLPGPAVLHKDKVMRGLIYMQVSISGQALIFVTRTAGINTWFFADKPSNLLLIAFVFAQVVASLLGAFGMNGYPGSRTGMLGCGGGYTIIAWLWAIVWQFPLDLIKFAVNAVLQKGAGSYTQAAFSQSINAGHPSMSHSRVSSRTRSIRASRTV
jgi:H+-transporting ATPase